MLIFEFRIVFKCSDYIQKLGWHSVDDLDFDDGEADILEIFHESGTPVLDGTEPV